MNTTAIKQIDVFSKLKDSDVGTSVLNILKLLKLRLCFFLSFTAYTGYVIATPQFRLHSLFITFSVFILACGAAALNNYQDRFYDLQFQRKKKRPLPAQHISEKSAIITACVFISLGLSGLHVFSSTSGPLILGILSIITYNGLYTPLKKKTLLAILPGIICGILPPYIAWISAGETNLNIQILFLMIVIGIWQMPHFLLIQSLSDSEYLKTDGPNWIKSFLQNQRDRILITWTSALIAVCISIPLFFPSFSRILYLLEFGFGTALFLIFFRVVFQKKQHEKWLLIGLYAYLFIFLVLLIINQHVKFY